MEDQNAERSLCLRWNVRLPVGAGLWNLANTCFLNSVLQCLTYTPPLANYILSGEHSNTCSSPTACIMCSMQKHMIEVFAGTGSAIVPYDMISKLHLISEQFCLGRQEDAHEFYSYTVQALEQSYMLGMETGGTNLIKKIFEGCMRSRVKCLSCRAESDTFEPYVDIALDITREVEDLTDALELFVRSEQLDGYKCNRCMKTNTASKTISISRSSNVLTICLKRFNFFGDKISKMVRYPSYLNISPFMSDGGSDEERQTYKLYAVLVHSGFNCHIGHYYCYVKAADHKWYVIDDSKVSVADNNSVFTEQAYMLFYIRTSKTHKKEIMIDRYGESSGIDNTMNEKPATVHEINTPEKQRPQKSSYQYSDAYAKYGVTFNTTLKSTGKRCHSPDEEESAPTAKQAQIEITATLQQPLQEEFLQNISTPEKQRPQKRSYQYSDAYATYTVTFNTTLKSTGKRCHSSDEEESPPTAKQAQIEITATLQQPLQEEFQQNISTPEKQRPQKRSYQDSDAHAKYGVTFNTTLKSTGKRCHSPDEEESPPTAKQAQIEITATLQQPLQEEYLQNIRTPETQQQEEGSDEDSSVYSECSAKFYIPQQSTGKRKHSQSSDEDEPPPTAKRTHTETHANHQQ